jgi:hypothetical protein
MEHLGRDDYGVEEGYVLRSFSEVGCWRWFREKKDPVSITCYGVLVRDE